ncbi:ribosome-associated translation inhibitor RaiA [Parendozoicomonas sp. Alg238-R29]|uniref:ribosome hibernation-promoting factor, HPF/YfiA family n=1 Tax=Parendozoicomonas sp. Alg238-R29 TaxID=2993446 RepID=UPI00248EF45A|nr:ribosome-associated translation inhibitor RaiA [Parendozoicomonas sp. Alg238-R29]
MQVKISGHQFDVTEALNEYVSKKLNKLASHYDGITSVQVTLSIEKQRQCAEATLHVRSADIAASAEHEDMYAAIDLLTDKLDRQLLKYKEKNIDRLQGASH